MLGEKRRHGSRVYRELSGPPSSPHTAACYPREKGQEAQVEQRTFCPLVSLVVLGDKRKLCLKGYFTFQFRARAEKTEQQLLVQHLPRQDGRLQPSFVSLVNFYLSI